jgi:zinc transport system substrate-binding protein
MKQFRLTVALLLGLSVMTGAAADGSTEKVPVFVSIVPQKYFVEKIGGDLVDVSVMVEPGASPHDYEPKPQQMAALAEAKIYYAVGIEFERVWLEKFMGVNRETLTVHTERGIEKIPLKAHYHGNGGKDPHVWLSPSTVMVQARNILKGLLAVDPDHRSTYESNYREFIIELVDLDASLRELFAGKEKRIGFMVFHPAWGYFADAYGLEQVPVEIEGKDPKPAELQHLIHHAKERGIKVVFVTPQFSTKSAETVATAIDGQIAFVDPLALNWKANLIEVAEKFRAALR